MRFLSFSGVVDSREVVTAHEAERIRAEYASRDQRLPTDWYSLTRPAILFACQQRARSLMTALQEEGFTPLDGKKILDVGCGEGQQLVDLVSWGAEPSHLFGIDLIAARVDRASRRLGRREGEGGRGPDLRVGDASHLPWAPETFDIAHQNTVFTSILADDMRKNVALEILRVLKPGGVLMWYDFLYNNPQNRNVRGIRRREIQSLFPGCDLRLQRITLAPPIARRLVPITWVGSLLLEKLIVLNTHYLAVIRKPGNRR